VHLVGFYHTNYTNAILSSQTNVDNTVRY